MVYEKPKLEMVELDETDLICTSGDLEDLGPGDVSGGVDVNNPNGGVVAP